jgi:hypothetical protein
MSEFDAGQSAADYCYLTTRGRVSGRDHTIEIWFALQDGVLYMLSGGRDRSDWVRNLLAQPRATLRLGEQTYRVEARFPEAGSDEDGLARRLLLEKYSPRYADGLQSWSRESLSVALAPSG